MASAGGTRGLPRWLFLVGLPIGFLSSLSGIGGGLFAGSFLHFALGFDLRRATGTALVLVFGTTAAATASELVRSDGALHAGIVAALVVGALAGAQLGFLLSERLPDGPLRVLFAVVLLASSAKVLLAADATAPGGPAAVAFVASPLGYAWALLVGVGGGIASPLLGVGGGLVVVPGLFLGLAHFGFDAARACSLAAGAAGSLRSLALKARAGRVSWGHGLLLGAGSLVGSAAGVQALSRLPWLLELGRLVLGVVLALVGLRFVRELLRGRGQA